MTMMRVTDVHNHITVHERRMTHILALQVLPQYCTSKPIDNSNTDGCQKVITEATSRFGCTPQY